jgi:hypothetical protein
MLDAARGWMIPVECAAQKSIRFLRGVEIVFQNVAVALRRRELIATNARREPMLNNSTRVEPFSADQGKSSRFGLRVRA